MKKKEKEEKKEEKEKAKKKKTARYSFVKDIFHGRIVLVLVFKLTSPVKKEIGVLVSVKKGFIRMFYYTYEH